MTKLVRKTLADSPMPPARKRKLARLAEQPDAEIDFSDIPPLTVRLDADVVAWLRRQGKGYQTRLNRVLREAMLEDIRRSA